MGLKELISNSPMIIDWNNIEDLISREIGDDSSIHLTDAEFAGLAYIFGRMSNPSDLERFLNLMLVIVPIDDLNVPPNFRNIPTDLFPGDGNIVVSHICQEKASRLAFHLKYQIAEKLIQQIEWWDNGFCHDSLDASRTRMQDNYILLKILSGLGKKENESSADRNRYLFISREGTSPFIIDRVRIENTHQMQIRFHYGVVVDSFFVPSYLSVSANAASTRTITISPSYVAMRQFLQAAANERFEMFRQTDMFNNILLGMLAFGVGKGIGPVYGSFMGYAASAIKAFGGFLKDADTSRRILNNHDLTIYYWDLAAFHLAFGLGGNVVTDISNASGSRQNPTQVHSWITAETRDLLNLFNEVMNPPLRTDIWDQMFGRLPSTEPFRSNNLSNNLNISWEDFINDPRIAFDRFGDMTSTQEEELRRRTLRFNRGANPPQPPPI